MSGHLPGPWEYDQENGRVLAKDARQTIVCEVTGSPWGDIPRADGRLIAAAPELYEALTRLLSCAAGGPHELQYRSEAAALLSRLGDHGGG